ncbi:DUF2214 family protein [Chitinibacteraceae bacterium HSL-7]
MLDALLATAHFVAIFLLITFLAIETVLVRREWMPAAAAKLARYDLLYFLSAMLVLGTGLARLYFGAKGVPFIATNPVFHAKMTVFVVIALLSIYPTLRFMAWRRATSADPLFVPEDAELKRVRRLLMWESHLIVLMPLLGAMMARGVGL